MPTGLFSVEERYVQEGTLSHMWKKVWKESICGRKYSCLMNLQYNNFLYGNTDSGGLQERDMKKVHYPNCQISPESNGVGCYVSYGNSESVLFPPQNNHEWHQICNIAQKQATT